MACFKTPFWRLIRLLFFVPSFTIGNFRQNVKPTPPTNKPKLLDQVREVIRRKHYSIRPEQALGEKPAGVKSSESRRRNHRVARRARVRRGQLFFPVAEHFTAQRAAIDAGEFFFHCGCQQ